MATKVRLPKCLTHFHTFLKHISSEYANVIKSSINTAIFMLSNLSSANGILSNLVNFLGPEHSPLCRQVNL